MAKKKKGGRAATREKQKQNAVKDKEAAKAKKEATEAASRAAAAAAEAAAAPEGVEYSVVVVRNP